MSEKFIPGRQNERFSAKGRNKPVNQSTEATGNPNKDPGPMDPEKEISEVLRHLPKCKVTFTVIKPNGEKVIHTEPKQPRIEKPEPLP